MPYVCSVLGCDDKISTRHRFPHPGKYSKRYKEWIILTGNKKLLSTDANNVYKNCRICHIHFTEEDRGTNMYLKPTAYPKLFLPTKLKEDSFLELCPDFGGKTSNEHILDSSHNKFQTCKTPKIIKNLLEKHSLANLSVLDENEAVPTNHHNISFNLNMISNNGLKKNKTKDEITETRSEPVMKKIKVEPEEASCSQLHSEIKLEEDQETTNNTASNDFEENKVLIICRTCLNIVENCDFTELNVSQKQNDLRERLLYCFSIDLYEDGDGVVCKTCVNQIDEAYIFKKKLSFIQDAFKKHKFESRENINVLKVYKSNKTYLEEYEKQIIANAKKDEHKCIKKEVDNFNASFSKQDMEEKINYGENCDMSIDAVLEQQKLLTSRLFESIETLKSADEKEKYCTEEKLSIFLDKNQKSLLKNHSVAGFEKDHEDIVAQYINRDIFFVNNCIKCRICFPSREDYLDHLKLYPNHEIGSQT